MKRFIMLIVCMITLYNFVYSQDFFVLSGTITDENNKPLPGATIFVSPSEKGATANSEGKYVIDGLKKGSYSIEISFIGYNKFTDTLLVNNNTVFNVKLLYTALTLQEVVIAGNYSEAQKKEQALNIEIVDDDYLKQNLGGSLMKSLERLPGITTIDIGSGQSKPVIRGLGFNRVVVVENGIKHEGQQWGVDHGLEIDQYAVDNLEVIKGPASLMYGSDAIGGVIDVKQNNIPHNNYFGGTIDLTGKSNNNLLGTSVSLATRKNWFYLDIRASWLDYGDYTVPTDSVDIYSYKAALYKNKMRNTAGEEKNLHLSLGIITGKFQSKFFISDVNSKSGFFANAHGLEPRNVDTGLHDKSDRDILYPYQEVNHFKLINKSLWIHNNIEIETKLGFQRNFRQELSEYVNHGWMPPVPPDDLGFDIDLERQFDKYIYSGNFKANYSYDKNLISFGIDVAYQDNRISGRGFIIPAFKQLNSGSYIFARYFLLDKSIIQAGLRYDFGQINTESYYDWFQSPVVENGDTSLQYLQRAGDINRNFSNISWSVGYNYNPKKWMLKVNLGKSFRIPIAKELAANGVNYHRFSYEVGNTDLSPEISYQFDAGIEFHSKKFAIGCTPFANYFDNYIYLNPSSEHDRLYGNGNQVYYYTQSKVFRYGGEIHSHYQLFRNIKLGIIGEYVYSEQLSGEKKGFTIPFSPPASAIFNIKYQKQKLYFIENVYVSLDYRLVASQNNIVPPEEITDGYRLINLGLGGALKIKNQSLDFSLQVQNLLNNKYFNHTSYYRLINVPEPARNFILNISIPFSGKNKQE